MRSPVVLTWDETPMIMDSGALLALRLRHWEVRRTSAHLGGSSEAEAGGLRSGVQGNNYVRRLDVVGDAAAHSAWRPSRLKTQRLCVLLIRHGVPQDGQLIGS